MKRLFALMLAVVMVLALAACGNAAQTESTLKNESEPSSGSNAQTEPSTPADGTESGASQTGDVAQAGQTEGGSSMLVAYFSLAGEQYGVGVIEEGNTSIIAHMIAEQTGADLFEIEAVDPYPTSHSELLDVSRREMASNARPEIARTVENMDDYDTIFIGYPNWWGDMPMIVYNFLESYDLSDKTIVPFCTHGGSGLSGTERTIEDITGGTMMDGFAIAGTTAQNDRDTARSEVAEWLREDGLVE
ncbi:MAG: flavodoxin [Eggerthellaceae bacterium]|nr:flavodoxin [Eggerthellaceae bacterium]